MGKLKSSAQKESADYESVPEGSYVEQSQATYEGNEYYEGSEEEEEDTYATVPEGSYVSEAGEASRKSSQYYSMASEVSVRSSRRRSSATQSYYGEYSRKSSKKNHAGAPPDSVTAESYNSVSKVGSYETTHSSGSELRRNKKASSVHSGLTYTKYSNEDTGSQESTDSGPSRKKRH